MPFAQITRNENPRLKNLEDRLASEWKDPQEGNAEPVIIEESVNQQAPENLYVVWEEWHGLSQRDRSRVILNAYERVQGRNFALNVTVAMGVTAAEAQQYGIEYEPVSATANARS